MKTSQLSKRVHGQYYTKGNPFFLSPFTEWAQKIGLKKRVVLEPFAGANHLIKALREVNYAKDFHAYDIYPQDTSVERRDTIQGFPQGFEVAITNPPWLAKNSASRRGLDFPETTYDDMYKCCLSLCLQYCKYVAALVPATFLQSGLFRDRLDRLIILHDQEMFSDTSNPVALALFTEEPADTEIYYDNELIGKLEELEKHLPRQQKKAKVKFNDPEGQLGFIAFDSTRARSIRFRPGEEISQEQIKHTTRMITRIRIDTSLRIDQLIEKLNKAISAFRDQTQDVFLTPFKGLRSDGLYRRRMEYALAKRFILQYA